MPGPVFMRHYSQQQVAGATQVSPKCQQMRGRTQCDVCIQQRIIWTHKGKYLGAATRHWNLGPLRSEMSLLQKTKAVPFTHTVTDGVRPLRAESRMHEGHQGLERERWGIYFGCVRFVR